MSPLLALFAAVLLMVIVLDYLRLRRAIAPRARPPERLAIYPSVTVIRPIRGVDVNGQANTAALLDLEYPGKLEIFFVFDDLDDPGAQAVRAELARRAPMIAPRVELMVAPPRPAGRTGKLNAMIAGLEKARGELVAFCDSDTRPSPLLLRHLVDALIRDPRAGDAFAPVVVSDALTTAGDVGYALLENAWYGASVASTAGEERALPFIMGQFMVFRRPAIAAIGGLACADGQLVDDMYLGRRIAEAGYRNVMVREPLHISTGGMPFSEFTRVFRRWILFSRNGLPNDFTLPNWLRGVALWSALALCIGAALFGVTVAAVLAGTAVLVSMVGQASLHRHFGGAHIPLRYAWVPFVLPLGAPFLVISCWLAPHVEWRGRPYALGKHARLA